MDHRLFGMQRELQAENKRDDFSFISKYFDLKENKVLIKSIIDAVSDTFLDAIQFA
jgi:hypothetical protein